MELYLHTFDSKMVMTGDIIAGKCSEMLTFPVNPDLGKEKAYKHWEEKQKKKRISKFLFKRETTQILKINIDKLLVSK